MWLISYRGEGKTGVENSGVFEDDGTPRKKHPLLLAQKAGAHQLHIARGFALVGDDLYIANAWRKDSHITRYRRQGDTFGFAEVVAHSKDVAAMVHPFDLELGDDGRLYISCQDTNTVIALLPKTRKPAPVAAHLRKTFQKGNFLPCTLVASSQGKLPEAGARSPVDMPWPQGLKVVPDVHGIVVYRGHRYVADEAGDAVKIFQVKSGRQVAHIKGSRLTKTMHLILHHNTLYIGAAGSGSILAFDIAKKAPYGKLKARTVINGKLHAPSGFAMGPMATFTSVSALTSGWSAFRPRAGKKRALSSTDCRTCPSSWCMWRTASKGSARMDATGTLCPVTPYRGLSTSHYTHFKPHDFPQPTWVPARNRRCAEGPARSSWLPVRRRGCPARS